MNLTFDHVHKQFGDLPVVGASAANSRPANWSLWSARQAAASPRCFIWPLAWKRPRRGQVLADGKPVAGPHPSRTLVFQEHALYPWLTLQDNVALALEFQNIPRHARGRRAHWLARVGLGGFEKYYPHQVSGGMRQRARWRAFIAQPQTMLMDEPFGALDALTRLSLQDVLRQLIAQERPTVLLVTHDVDEALFLADRIVVFSARPARVLREFNLAHRVKSHDLSDLADEKREILRLLGISVGGASAHADMALAA